MPAPEDMTEEDKQIDENYRHMMKIFFLVYHEMRHLYQKRAVNVYLINQRLGGSVLRPLESDKKCALWLSEMQAPGPNQDIEEDADDFAYYFQSYSNINQNDPEENFGSIFINFRYFIQEWLNTNNEAKLFDQLEEIIFHELRHYYDNIVGIYRDNTDDYKIIDLELWCEQCLKKVDDIENLPLLRSLTYIMDETELNAFTQSFYVLIKKYILANKGNISKQNIIDNIYSN
jgi:hypothetical protein